MEKRLTKITAVLMMLGLMTAGSVAYAESQEEGPGMQQPGSGDEGAEHSKGYRHGGGKDFFKDLNLTSEQKEKLETQREAKKDSVKALREQMKTKMQVLHEEITKPASKRADVNGLVNEVNALKGQMFSQMIDGVFAMKEILTPEQFAKMQAKHKERMDKRHEGWGKKDQGPEQD